MKKTICFMGLFCALNVFAEINVDALLGGKTSDVICFAYGAPSDPQKLDGIECGAFKGVVQFQKLNKVSTLQTIAQFATSRIWTLTGTFVSNNNSTTFVLIKK